jgi:RNA ligase (TIGR02306 family)
MSDHAIEVIKISNIVPHGNADSLEHVRVYGFTCIVRIGDFKVGDLACYIQPDSLIDTTREEFAFLAPKAKADGSYRIRATRLRNEWSQGLLIPAKPGWKEGQDVSGELSIVHYEPSEQGGGGANKGKKTFTVPIPKVGSIPVPEYTEIENWRKYNKTFLPDELVIATSKIHGSCSRFCYSDGTLHQGSHHQWKSQYVMLRSNGRLSLNAWINRPIVTARFLATFIKAKLSKPTEIPLEQLDNWCKIAKLYNLEEKLSNYPEYEFFGEIYGNSVQKKYVYDTTPDEPLKIRFFDIYDVKKGKYLNYKDACDILDKLELPKVPLMYVGPWNEEFMKNLAEGEEPLSKGKHVMEGLVIRPQEERYDRKLGRVILKLISNNYLAKDQS